MQYISIDTMRSVIGKKVTLTLCLKHNHDTSKWIRCSLVPKSKYDNSDYNNYYNNIVINPGDQFTYYTNTFDFTAENNINEDYVLILWYYSGTRSLQIKNVKLEIGENSTLHLDTPPNPKEEAIRCMLSTADASDTYANKTLQQPTGDEWDSTYPYIAGDYRIHANQLWLCKVDNSGQVPSEGTYWTATSVSRVLQSLDARIKALEG